MHVEDKAIQIEKQMHKTPQNFKFIADGYAAYPLASNSLHYMWETA